MWIDGKEYERVGNRLYDKAKWNASFEEALKNGKYREQIREQELETLMNPPKVFCSFKDDADNDC